MQIVFFNQVLIFFPRRPDNLLFTIPNRGALKYCRSKELKTQNLTNVMSQIPKNESGFLILEFRPPIGKQTEEYGNKQYVVVRSLKEAIYTLK